MPVDSGLSRKRISILVVVIVIAVAVLVWRTQHLADSTPPLSAVELSRRAQEQPNNAESQIEWGAQLVQEKRFDEANQVLKHAQELAPTDGRPYAWLGVIAAGMHAPETRGLFGSALKHDPDEVNALRGLAYLDVRENNRQNAIDGFQHLVKLNPMDAESWQRIGLIYYMSGEKSRSLNPLLKAAELNPNDMLTQRTLGIIYAGKGNLSEAKRALTQVVTKQPSDSDALAILSLVTMRMDSSPSGLKTAEDQADKAWKIHPTAEVYRSRCQIYMAQRRFKLAINDLNSAIRLEPFTHFPYLLLSQCYASIGKSDMARKVTDQYDTIMKTRLQQIRTGTSQGNAPK